MAETTGRGLRVPRNPVMALRELNRKHAASTTTEETPDAENTTILQTNKPIDKQTKKQTSRPTNKQSDKQTVNPTNLLTDGRDKSQDSKPTDTAQSVDVPVTVSREPFDRVPAQTILQARPPRLDGRTMRIRQATADATMVTSFRLAVSTMDRLDDFCWHHRMRKQDVIQAALDLYFETTASDNSE